MRGEEGGEAVLLVYGVDDSVRRSTANGEVLISMAEIELVFGWPIYLTYREDEVKRTSRPRDAEREKSHLENHARTEKLKLYNKRAFANVGRC